MVRCFNEQLPNVAVNRIAGGGETLEKLITDDGQRHPGGRGGHPPGLHRRAYMEGPRPLQDLRQFVKRDSSVIKDTDHVEGIVQALTHKGSLYALPVGIYTNHAALNQDLLAQKGIPLPAPTWTAEQALEVARRATERKETEEASTWGIYHMWGSSPTSSTPGSGATGPSR